MFHDFLLLEIVCYLIMIIIMTPSLIPILKTTLEVKVIYVIPQIVFETKTVIYILPT